VKPALDKEHTPGGDSSSGSISCSTGGTGVSSTLKLSNTAWQFSAHPVGETSGKGTIYLTNTGHAAVTFTSIKIVEPGPTSNFNLVGNTCGSSLAPSVTCALMFNFAPKTSGAHLAWLNVSVSSDKHPLRFRSRATPPSRWATADVGTTEATGHFAARCKPV
jgi:hypothetical protein